MKTPSPREPPAPFSIDFPLIGVVHLLPLPGAPGFAGSMDAIVERALADADALAAGGMDGVLVENFGDAPFYAGALPPETVAAMTRVVRAVRERVTIPVGVNALRNDPLAALAIAAATSATFVRVNVHVGAAWTDQGLVVGRAAETLRLRRQLAPGVAIFADVAVKHASPITPRPLVDEARDCLERGKADAIIVTGPATGRAVDTRQLGELRAALPRAPIFAGSGVTADMVPELRDVADGVIVGTALKLDGLISNPVDRRRVREIVAAARPHVEGRSR